VKISEIIAQLEAIREKTDDLEVVCAIDIGDGFEIHEGFEFDIIELPDEGNRFKNPPVVAFMEKADIGLHLVRDE